MSLFQNLRRRFTATPVMQDWPGLIEAYRSWLPVTDATPVISLREGATPLIPVPHSLQSTQTIRSYTRLYVENV